MHCERSPYKLVLRGIEPQRARPSRLHTHPPPPWCRRNARARHPRPCACRRPGAMWRFVPRAPTRRLLAPRCSPPRRAAAAGWCAGSAAPCVVATPRLSCACACARSSASCAPSHAPWSAANSPLFVVPSCDAAAPAPSPWPLYSTSYTHTYTHTRRHEDTHRHTRTHALAPKHYTVHQRPDETCTYTAIDSRRRPRTTPGTRRTTRYTVQHTQCAAQLNPLYRS